MRWKNTLVSTYDAADIWGQRIFPVGGDGVRSISVASLNMKNLMSPTPRNWVLNALILALKDSADALVSLRSK